MTKAKEPAVWDRHSIKAEVHRRGMTLTGIARDAGLNDADCRKALFGLSRRGADAIAAALDIPFDELFPTGFLQSRSNSRHPSGNKRSSERQKRQAHADTARASA